MVEFSPVAAAKKQAVPAILPDTNDPKLAHLRIPPVRLALNIMAGIGQLAFFGSIALFYWLFWSSPGTRASSTGQTVEMNNHGSLFFVRDGQALVFNLLCYGGAVLFWLALGLQLAIFGTRSESEPAGWTRHLSIVGFGILALALAMVATNGRFPFDMASFR